MFSQGYTPSWTEPLIITIAMMLPSMDPTAAASSSMDACRWLLNGSAQALSQFVLLYIIIGKSNRLSYHGAKALCASDLLKAVLLAFLLLSSSMIYIKISESFQQYSNGSWLFSAPDAANTYIPQNHNMGPFGIMALSFMFSLSVAYREELLYRLYIVGSMRERGLGSFFSVLLSSCIFAMGHGYQGIGGFASAFAAGLICATAYQLGYGLHALAIGHGLYNFFILLSVFGMF